MILSRDGAVAAMLMLYPDDIPGLEVTPNARNDTMGMSATIPLFRTRSC